MKKFITLAILLPVTTISQANPFFDMLSGMSGGGAIPVHDNEVMNAVYGVAGINFDISKTSTDNLIELVAQNAQLEKLISILSGNYEYGKLANDNFQQEARRYAPENWENALEILSSGKTLGDRTAYSGFKDTYSKRYNDMAGSITYALSDDNASLHDENINTAAASYYISEKSYNQTETRLKNVEQLMQEIDNAADLKQAIDLNNRLSAENAISLAEVIRLQSVLLKVEANELQQENNIVANEAELINF